MKGEGDELRSTAVRNLTALGLSEYAARTLVALTRIGGGSARDVSEASTVPRTRVYDAVDQLAERGFVTVRESHPKVFDPVSPQRIRRAFYREYVYRLAVAEWGLRAIGFPESGHQWRDVDVEVGAADVYDRFLDVLETAEDHLTYVTVGERPRSDVIDTLVDATDRGVGVRVVCVGAPDGDELAELVPDATVLSVPSTATPPNDSSRLLVVDESVGVLGTWDHADDEQTAVGLFSERPGSDVTVLLQQVVDTWLADVE